METPDHVFSKNDQRNYYVGVYFGFYETKGCLFTYEGLGSVKDLVYEPPPNECQISKKKFVPTLPDPNQIEGQMYACVKQYSDMAATFINQKVEGIKYIDGVCVVFPEFPKHFSADQFKIELCPTLTDRIRDTPDGGEDKKSRVTVMEELDLWKELTKDDGNNIAVSIHSTYHAHLHWRDGPGHMSLGLPGDELTVERLGLLGIDHIKSQLEAKQLEEVDRDPIFIKAKQIFEVDNHDALIDAVKFEYSVPKICELAETVLSEDTPHDEIDNFGTTLLEKTITKLNGEKTVSEGFQIVLVGPLADYFDTITRKYAAKNGDTFDLITFKKFVKREMIRPEVAAAVLAAKNDGRDTDFHHCSVLNRTS